MTSSSKTAASAALAAPDHGRLDGGKLEPFLPAWWLPGGHAQTLWGKLAPRRTLPSGRLLKVETPDGDFVQLFRVAAQEPSAPRLVLLHGLEGGLDSHYARGIAGRAAEAGWGVDFLLFRGCGTELNRAPRFYHSGETGDFDLVLERVRAEYPEAPLVLAGYSLGGNVLLKWLGERGGAVPSAVRGAAAVSVPYDLAAGARYISRGFSHVYERHFLRTLKVKAALKLGDYPGLFDGDALARASTILAFDEAVTAPVHGFADADDYYFRSSSIRFLSDIRLPTLLLSAYDDPFLPPRILASVAEIAGANSRLTPSFTRHGGHVGFVAGSVPGVPRYYSEDRLMAFFSRQIQARAPGASD